MIKTQNFLPNSPKEANISPKIRHNAFGRIENHEKQWTCSEGDQDVIQFLLSPEDREVPLLVPQPEPHLLLRPDLAGPAVEPVVPGQTAPVVNILLLPDWEVAVHVAVNHSPLAQSGHNLPEQWPGSQLEVW